MQVSANSFCIFAFPFNFGREEFKNRMTIVDGESSLDWEPASFTTDELVDGVLRNQEGSCDDAVTDFRSWKLSTAALRSWSGIGAQWNMVIGQSSTSGRRIPFEFDEVRLCLFNTGTGILLLKITLPSGSFADWLDVLHYFRFSDGGRDVGIEGHRSIPPQAKNKAKPFDFIGTLSERIRALLRSSDDASDWWTSTYVRGQLVPFFCLLAEGCDDASAYVELYQLRNLFHSRAHLIPSNSDLSPTHQGISEYVENQWFVYSLDGGGFYSRNPPDHPFFKQTLCSHVADQYLLLFTLVLHQRFHISTSLRQIASEWIEHANRRKETFFDRLKDIDIWYTTRFQLGQVAQGDHHQSFYEKWQEIFRVPSNFDEVKRKIDETQQHLQADRNRRIENRIDLFGALVGLPALIATLMSVSVIGWNTTEGWPAETFLGLIGASIILGLIWFFAFLRRT